jgi:hypothetical protein
MQLSRLQKINHGGSGQRGVFFLRHIAEVRKDGEPAAVDVMAKAFGIRAQVRRRFTKMIEAAPRTEI